MSERDNAGEPPAITPSVQFLGGIDDTIGRLDPGLPRSWATVTIRELLNHTSGVPNYTDSEGFRHQFDADPTGYVPASRIISWVAHERLRFTPGSRYRYSNTDNIVVGLIAERVTGRSYASLLRTRVFQPVGCARRAFPQACDSRIHFCTDI